MTQNDSEGKDRLPLPGCVHDVQSSLENRFVKKGAELANPIQMRKQVVTTVEAVSKMREKTQRAESKVTVAAETLVFRASDGTL